MSRFWSFWKNILFCAMHHSTWNHFEKLDEFFSTNQNVLKIKVKNWPWNDVDHWTMSLCTVRFLNNLKNLLWFFWKTRVSDANLYCSITHWLISAQLWIMGWILGILEGLIFRPYCELFGGQSLQNNLSVVTKRKDRNQVPY